MKIIQLFVFLAFTNQVLAKPSELCLNWFRKSKVSATQKDCYIECSAIGTGMDTMSCNEECEELCQNHCAKIDSNWRTKLSDKGPKNWPIKSEKFKPISLSDRKKILKALSKLPDSISDISIKGISRADRSVDFPNPASHGDESIVLYDTAINSNNLDRILAHELAHELYDDLSKEEKDSYKVAVNWIEVNIKGKEMTVDRGSGFVKEDGKLGPEEDFANNVEFYLYEKSRLKAVTLNAHNWLKEKYGDKFKLRGACEYN